MTLTEKKKEKNKRKLYIERVYNSRQAGRQAAKCNLRGKNTFLR
jgi:hypothetical protein